MTALPPGSTIGIIGGGQLGRMLSIAAAQLGYRCFIYAPEDQGPASDVSAGWVQGDYGDAKALAAFASIVDVVTFEFENIDPAPLRQIADHAPLYPPLDALEIGQDRIREKTFAADCGGRTAAWAKVDSKADLKRALEQIGTPAILKTSRFGYDGKGQVRIQSPTELDAAWKALSGGGTLILEKMIRFAHEFSLLVVRDQRGNISFWDAPENVHKDGILATSTLPAAAEVQQQIPAARALARKIAERLNYIGVFAIEFFASDDGPVFNEMAPRVHNSGHWTIEGAVASQFENHIRAVVGLPIASTKSTAPRIEMRNLIGADADKWLEWASDPLSHLHLYGKGAARPGRKMGHITRLGGL